MIAQAVMAVQCASVRQAIFHQTAVNVTRTIFTYLIADVSKLNICSYNIVIGIIIIANTVTFEL